MPPRRPASDPVREFVASRRIQVDEAEPIPTLEELFTGADYFGVTTATPIQRAICRVADGAPLGDLAHDPGVQLAFSSWTDATLKPDLTDIDYTPAELLILAATRCGKTRLAGSLAVRVSQTCDLSGLQHGEIPRIPIVSLTKELADEAFSQIVGTVEAQPKLRKLLVKPPTADTIMLRHPSGAHIAIMVAAGSKAGRNLIARWLAAVIFDEAPRMLGSDSGAVVNLNEQLIAIKDRMRGPIIEIGSPWAPMGPVYDKVTAYHGKPSRSLVVVRGKGPWLNPSWWTPERVASLKTSDKPEDRHSYRVNCDADFADPEEGLFSSVELDVVTRKGPAIIPPQPGHHYAASIDAATRKNAWTLQVKTRALRDGAIVDVVVGAWQWQGSRQAPLDPDDIFGKIAEILNPKDLALPRYNVRVLAADQWSFDSMNAIARRHGLTLILHHLQGTGRTQAYLDAQVKVSTKLVETPPDPIFRSDLLAVRKRVTQDGLAIYEPVSGDGRHCDHAPAFVRLLQMPCPDPAKKETDADHLERRALEADLKAAKARRGDSGEKWWQKNPLTGKRTGIPKPPF